MIMKKITNNKKGAKMRKFILPLLVAGAVAITASQAFASGAVVKGQFTENHAYKSAFGAGTTTTLVAENPFQGPNTVINGGNHYKATDFVENGRHGFQLSSAILKSMASEASGFKADDAVGFVTGSNPFAPGGMVGLTEIPYDVPGYTAPCPEWVDGDNNIKTPGDCEANNFATDPQTEIDSTTWDGVVLDDLYQAVGAVDMFEGVRSYNGYATDENRALDQNLDILFYLGKRGSITIMNGATPSTVLQTGEGLGTGNKRHMNIDQTLDQDVTDWMTSFNGITIADANRDETMGIYGKLTQVFQNAGTVSSQSGCASAGIAGMDDSSATNNCIGVEYQGVGDWEAAALRIETQQQSAVGQAMSGAAKVADWAAFIVDQWVVSDVWDWHHRGDSDSVTYDADKERGFGVQQSYSGWFRDGDNRDWAISHTYDTGHGSTAGTVSANENHQHPDP